MKHLKRFAACCAAAVCCAAMLLLATGCQQQQESYTPPEATPSVSKPVIAQEGVLRVGVNANNAPLAGQPSSSTKIVGIDMAAALADQLGLKLEVVDVSTDAAGALTSGKVDVVMGVNKSDSPSFWTSDTYLPTAVALFAQSSNSTVPANSASTKIAAQVSSNSAWAVTNEFDNSTITTTEDSITFHTIGYGHGVGLSQYGAKYLAEQGATYQDILSNYYQDTVLTRI